MHFFKGHEYSCVQQDMVVFLGNVSVEGASHMHGDMIFALSEHSTSTFEYFTSTFREIKWKCMKMVSNLQVKLRGYLRFDFPTSDRQNF